MHREWIEIFYLLTFQMVHALSRTVRKTESRSTKSEGKDGPSIRSIHEGGIDWSNYPIASFFSSKNHCPSVAQQFYITITRNFYFRDFATHSLFTFLIYLRLMVCSPPDLCRYPVIYVIIHTIEFNIEYG